MARLKPATESSTYGHVNLVGRSDFEPLSRTVFPAYQLNLEALHNQCLDVLSDFGFCMLDQMACLQCFDAVGWVAGRASGL